VDESLGPDGGWKAHLVKSVDMERNRVYLEGVSVGALSGTGSDGY
jgi:hypothetical protein